MNIQSNSFAAACYDMNSIDELTSALDAYAPGEADKTDCATWSITPTEWREQIEAALAVAEARANTFGTESIEGGLSRTLDDLPKSVDVAKVALGQYRDAEREALSAILSLGKATTGYLASLIGSGETEKATEEAGKLRDAYLEQFAAVGITGAAADEYIRILGLAPDQVETAVILSGVEEATFKIDTYIALMGDKLTEDQITTVLAYIDAGSFKEAGEWLALFRKQSLENPVVVPVVIGAAAVAKGAAARVRGGGFFDRREHGGPVAPATPYVVGEVGPELFVPRTAGTVVSTADLGRMMGNTTSKAGPAITINTTSSDYQESLEGVVRALRDPDLVGGF